MAPKIPGLVTWPPLRSVTCTAIARPSMVLLDLPGGGVRCPATPSSLRAVTSIADRTRRAVSIASFGFDRAKPRPPSSRSSAITRRRCCRTFEEPASLFPAHRHAGTRHRRELFSRTRPTSLTAPWKRLDRDGPSTGLPCRTRCSSTRCHPSTWSSSRL